LRRAYFDATPPTGGTIVSVVAGEIATRSGAYMPSARTLGA
jgi:hypothetical protein